jgi:cellulose synthase/poly-beta-1,6-N-acetylglucosamine synthase-like glycosyltransferase
MIRYLRLDKGKTIKKNKDFTPKVAILFAAYNECDVIENKIKSILNSSYPTEKIQIWIGSDLSNDGTDEIVQNVQKSHSNIHLYRATERSGKSAIMNILVEKADAEVLIATDANILFTPTTIQELIQSFADDKVGAVAGSLHYHGEYANHTAKSENEYLLLENVIRLSESQHFGFCLGMEGGLYAIRKNLWTVIPPATFMEDFFQTMKIIEQQYQIIFNPNAVGLEEISTSISEEYKRKTRIALGNFQNLKRFQSVLFKNFWPTGYAFLFHKVLRWFTPHILIVLILSLILNPITTFFGIGLLGFCFLQFLLVKWKIHGRVAYFCAMNLAMLMGHLRYLKGVKSSVWQPTKRNQ